MTTRKTRLLGAALAAALLAAAASATAAADRPAVPAFSIDDLDGREVSLEALRGKVVVVSFWATWCVPCKQELVHVQKLYDELKGQGLEVLAVATDGPETFSRIRGFVRRHKWTFPILPDREGKLAALINPRGVTPYTMFIDRAGRLAFDHEGFAKGDEQRVEKQIRELLAEPAP